ncbi:MAG: hypothetical protein HN352_02275 [Bacteroidetes bacterium]|jgi:hypothetical protein|nr:hypothetical protein [Bacteroidota bacterium]MBT3750735.1 hypothetical protein [Bacteroidota bacterium]MBT4399711.1 hypothetical protein [Bacteroidota bacterium]MBT4412056.1 hypothetical protein [Bacteroidota bacterium]MBT5427786.1 hypothetical protein [Bacteroidota bacterium]
METNINLREWVAQGMNNQLIRVLDHLKNYKYSFVYFSFLIWGVLANQVSAQTNHLEADVNVDIQNMPLQDALLEIGDAAGFSFSYNSEIIPGDSIINVHANNETVDKVLVDLLGDEYRYKVIGNHLIILESIAPKKPTRDERKRTYTISGYIIDSRTGEKISQASIYEVELRQNSFTNKEGYYSLSLPATEKVQYLNYSKVGYLDTVIIVRPVDEWSHNVYLSPLPDVMIGFKGKSEVSPDIHKRPVVAALVPKRAVVMADNVQVHEERLVQVSFLPFVGTNRFVTGLITNRFSVNILAGYSGGVNGLELGGFQNIVRGDMRGVQLAGFGNVVGGISRGFQGAGFFNVTAGSMVGTQAAGFGNVALDTIRGTQLAGFFNTLHGPMYGLQASGFANFTSQNVDGVQAAGFTNVAVKDVKIAQASGFANYCRSVEGLQIAGFANVASRRNSGTQIAGFINYATEVDGLQLSVFNVSDTVSSGVPIGFFSFVRKGFHEVEISSNELFWLNLEFKTGTHRFYNIFSAGAQKELAYAGYGLGTQFNLNRSLSISLEANSKILNRTDSFEALVGTLNQLKATFNVMLAKNFSLLLGPSINLLTEFDSEASLDLPLTVIKPFYDKILGNTRSRAWVGITAGVRI